jgi:hypothetical protein
MNRQRGILAAAAVAALVVATLLMWPSTKARPAQPSASTEQDVPSRVHAAEAGEAKPAAAREPGIVPLLDETLNPRRNHLLNAETYRTRARYPSLSEPLQNNNDPVANATTPAVHKDGVPGQPDAPTLVHYGVAAYNEADQPLVLHAYLVDRYEQKMRPDSLTASLVSGEMGGRIIAKQPMQDGGPEDVAGDLVYTVVFKLPEELQAEATKPRIYTVILTAETPMGTIRATNGFLVGSMGIRDTGRYADRLSSDDKGTHLTVDAEFDVKKRGRYHVQASLYDRNGEGIGWAQASAQLEPGLHQIPLTFYGLMLFEKGTDGPYELRHLVYANVTVMPGTRSEDRRPEFTTKAYKASQFTSKPFDDPMFLSKAETLERLAAEHTQ